MSIHFLLTPLQFLRGVGPIRAQSLKKISLVTFWDALSHLPSQYETYTSGPLATLRGRPADLYVTCLQKLAHRPWRFLCRTSYGDFLELVFFHQPRHPLTEGSKWHIQGMIDFKGGAYQMVHPSLMRPRTGDTAAHGSSPIVPSYSLAKGLTSSQFSQYIQRIFQQWSCETDLFPCEADWPSLKQALWCAHFPVSPKDISLDALWRKRLAYDELIAQQLAHLASAYNYRHSSSIQFFSSSAEDHFLNQFGHILTPSQSQAWKEISSHLASPRPMMHLLHGDVGSGKTVVAFLALIRAASSGYEACLMAPTEILARQHFTNFCQWAPHVPAKLLLGKGKSLGPPDASITIGTHALLYEGISFSSLALIIIDEQQRFGVMQRFRLTAKGSSPHLLFLSATPIPRTFEMTLCGHMTTSRLDSRPQRQPLKSYLISDQRLDDLERWIKACLARQEAVYWVCPTIEEGVEPRYTYWNSRLPCEVAVLHGRMPSEEKERVMENFRTGRTPFLISTTVIEVGVHIPQASTMIIEESERFGLSQLHQLRGRVGRGSVPGHCFFMYHVPLSQEAYTRLDFMRKCHDGFEIAEKDWQWRGGGIRLGTQQSGFSSYKFTDLMAHQDLIPLALERAKLLWNKSQHFAKSDNDLEDLTPSHKEILTRLRLFGYGSPEILRAG